VVKRSDITGMESESPKPNVHLGRKSKTNEREIQKDATDTTDATRTMLTTETVSKEQIGGRKSQSNLVIGSVASHSFKRTPQTFKLAGLRDGSFVSFSSYEQKAVGVIREYVDNRLERWLISSLESNNYDNNNNNNNDDNSSSALQLQDSYSSSKFRSLVELDDETLVVHLKYDCLQVWKTKGFELIQTISFQTEPICFCVLKTRDNSSLLCVMQSGTVEVRRLNDLQLVVNSFYIRGLVHAASVCELEDGTFVGAGYGLVQWDMTTGTVIKTFPTTQQYRFETIMELKNDIVVAATHLMFGMWRVSTGECFCTQSFSETSPHTGIFQITKDFFGSFQNREICVWNERGDCIETTNTDSWIKAVARVGGDIVISTTNQIEVRPLRLVISLFLLLTFCSDLYYDVGLIVSGGCVVFCSIRIESGTMWQSSERCFQKTCSALALRDQNQKQGRTRLLSAHSTGWYRK